MMRVGNCSLLSVGANDPTTSMLFHRREKCQRPSHLPKWIRITPRQGASPARASTGLHVLELIPASEVERIRVLRGPSAAVEYPDATHGVILVEMRRDGL